MAWQCFRLTCELHSPLHIGYHTIGNVQRTRAYVPARNLWGAVTERLTRGGFSAEDAPAGDYQRMGNWVKQHCAFSYFFLCEGDTLLNPRYEEDGMYYGALTQAAFERRYLDAHVTTALDATTTSAEEASLHEVEFIAPHRLDNTGNGERTQLHGWLFLDETITACQDKIRETLSDLHIGGERRYGFGQLCLAGWKEDTLPDGYTVLSGAHHPRIEVKQNAPLLAHTLVDGIEARGSIEPVVGRETRSNGKFGQSLTHGQVCWSPGATLPVETTFQITENGLWKHD